MFYTAVRKSLTRRCFALLVFLSATSGFPASAQPSSHGDFDQGVKAFIDGDFQRALDYFNKARTEGLDTPALWYNIGVCFYRLQQYDAASATFTKLATVPAMRQVAHYNLGLTALKQQRPTAARDWFRRSLQGDDAKLRQLAAAALAQLNPAANADSGWREAWQGIVEIDVANDDNVARANEDITISKTGSDHYLELLFSGDLPLTGRRDDGVSVGAGYFRQQYAHESAYDFSQVRIYANLNTPVAASGQLRLFLDGDRSWLGHATFITTINRGLLASLRTTGPLGTLSLRYRDSRLRADDAQYDYLKGGMQQLRLAARRFFTATRLDMDYTYETNAREDLDRNGYFYSYSPQRQQLRAALRLPLTADWYSDLDLRYRLSSYADANHMSDGSEQRRRDLRSSLSLELTHQLDRQWRTGVQVSYLSNNSNISRYSYQRSVISLGTSYSW